MNNKEILLDVIGDTSPELIPDISPKKKKRRAIKWAAAGVGICAAAVIACIAIFPGGEKSSVNISPYSGLPQISGSKKAGSEKISSEITFGAMGYEALMVYDISELDTPNPWSEDSGITELPVFRNLAYTGNEGGRTALYLTEEQMTGIAENTASSLNTDITQTEIVYLRDFMMNVPERFYDGVYSVEAECSDKTKITVYGGGKIRIDFDGRSLPGEYSFTYSETSGEEAEATLKYLTEEYSSVLAFGEPACYSYADRSYFGEESRSYYVYDASGDTVQDILNYNLSNAQFCPDDYGNLMCIWLDNAFCSAEYLGDYPIISSDDAKALLLADSYISTVPDEYINGGSIAEDDIAKSELVYRTYNAEYYQPYYKFYVELDASGFEIDDGLHDYGIFYVPAVEAEYRD